MPYPEMTPERFWAKVDKNGPVVRPELEPCWLWPRINPEGYGKTTVKMKHWSAHRLAWVYTHGDIPDELCVCHVCDVRNCVNPSHLWLGTSQENTSDKVSKGRQATREKIVNAAFIKNYGLKLCEWDVRFIRMFAKEFSHREVAETFGISRRYVSELVGGQKWSHVPCV